MPDATETLLEIEKIRKKKSSLLIPFIEDI